MVPGMREIYSTLPKVRLALKMKKSPAIQWGWFAQADYLENLSNVKWRDGESNDIIRGFKLFFKDKDYSDDEILTGIALAGEKFNRIRYYREASRNGVNLKDRNAKDKFRELVLSRMYEVYAKREVPLFSRKTSGTIIYEPKIITEKRMMEFIEESRLSEFIKVFKFKDKHGRVSINFYAPSKYPHKPYQSTGRRGAWRRGR